MEKDSAEGLQTKNDPALPCLYFPLESHSGGKGVFVSCENALHWAYNVSGRAIVKTSMVNHMRQSSPRCRASNPIIDDLPIQEQHGQAALIVGMVERLPDPAERQYIEARFGRRLGKDDLRYLVYRCCSASGLELAKAEAVYRIVKGYFDGNATHRAIRAALGCRDQYAIMIRRCMYDTLDVIHNRALSDIAEAMQDHGLIRGKEELRGC